MRKLTFERAILIVFAAIIFISTTEIREKYTDIFKDRFLNKDRPVSAEVQVGNSPGFVTMLYKADNLYKEGRYEEAEMEYYTLTLNSALITEQKSRANFGLAMCQYHLGKYQQAFQSFLTAASFTTSNSIIYNNAAVSAYKAKDMEHAIEYQMKALNLLPAVEYYYNLGRMYEDNGQYDMALINYQTVAEAEQNLSKSNKIDPVRIKEKVLRLLLSNDDPSESKALMAYKLGVNINEVLTVSENEMQIKSGDFSVGVEDKRNTKSIVAVYDREKNDPYNLITEILWTVYRDGEQIYKKKGDKISVSARYGGNYKVELSIKYNGGMAKISNKTINIHDDQSIVDKGKQDDIIVKPPIRENAKTYEWAVYEQLFESDFDIRNKSYVDKYNVVWGSDSEVETLLNRKLAVDKSSSLLVNNISDSKSGIWINLDSLLKNTDIKDKKVKIRFYARKVSSDADIYVSIRVKSNNMYAITQDTLYLKYQFEEKTISVDIPKDATGFTMSMMTNAGEEFNIDRFTVVD